MTNFLQRCRGAGGKRPAHLGVRAVLLGGLGGFLAIGALALLSGSLDVMLLLGSFGASSVLLCGYPDAPFAQPMNVVGGHDGDPHGSSSGRIEPRHRVSGPFGMGLFPIPGSQRRLDPGADRVAVQQRGA
jgi:hypothetical protein